MKDIGYETIKQLKSIKEYHDKDNTTDVLNVQEKVEELFKLCKSIQNSNTAETLSDLVENELATMDKAIEEAAIRIEVICFFMLILH